MLDKLGKLEHCSENGERLRNMLSILMNFSNANYKHNDIDCVQFKLNSLIKITDHYQITDRKVRVIRESKFKDLLNTIESDSNLNPNMNLNNNTNLNMHN